MRMETYLVLVLLLIVVYTGGVKVDYSANILNLRSSVAWSKQIPKMAGSLKVSHPCLTACPPRAEYLTV